jgi:Glycosyltransferase family 29 (sialyltransferase)
MQKALGVIALTVVATIVTFVVAVAVHNYHSQRGHTRASPARREEVKRARTKPSVPKPTKSAAIDAVINKQQKKVDTVDALARHLAEIDAMSASEARKHHAACFDCNVAMVEHADDERRLGAYVPEWHLKELPTFNRCAVVFPSALLNRFEFGAEIDGHDAVFRINGHQNHDIEGGGDKVRAAQRHVGSKKTVRIVNRHMHRGPPYFFPHMSELLARHEIGIMRAGHTTPTPMTLDKSVLEEKPSNNFERTIGAVRRLNKTAFVVSSAYRLNQYRCQQQLRNFAGREDFTSGFDALRIARQQCAVVTLYGGGNHSCAYSDDHKRVLGHADYHDHAYEERLIARYFESTREQLTANGKAEMRGCQSLLHST